MFLVFQPWVIAFLVLKKSAFISPSNFPNATFSLLILCNNGVTICGTFTVINVFKMICESLKSPDVKNHNNFTFMFLFLFFKIVRIYTKQSADHTSKIF